MSGWIGEALSGLIRTGVNIDVVAPTSVGMRSLARYRWDKINGGRYETHRQRPTAVMPTEVGIHDFAALDGRKAWLPTSVGMTGNNGRYVIQFTVRYNISLSSSLAAC